MHSSCGASKRCVESGCLIGLQLDFLGPYSRIGCPLVLGIPSSGLARLILDGRISLAFSYREQQTHLGNRDRRWALFRKALNWKWSTFVLLMTTYMGGKKVL